MKRWSAGLALTAFCMAAPAFSGPRDKEIETLVEKAAAEHSVMVNCEALSKFYQNATIEYWERNLREYVMSAFAELEVAPDVLARLVQKTAPGGVDDRTKGTVGELIAYCRDNEELITKIRSMGGVNLPLELQKMLKQ